MVCFFVMMMWAVFLAVCHAEERGISRSVFSFYVPFFRKKERKKSSFIKVPPIKDRLR